MKYVVTMNGKQYEVEVERMSAFHQLTREEIASGVSTPVVPVVAPVPVQAAPVAAAPKPAPAPAPAPKPAPAPGTEARARTGTRSGSGSSTRRRNSRYLPDARFRARRKGQCW